MIQSSEYALSYTAYRVASNVSSSTQAGSSAGFDRTVG